MLRDCKLIGATFSHRREDDSWPWQGGASSIPDQAVVFGVSSNPEPKKIGSILHCQGAIMQPHSDRPQSADLFEV